ncbi:MAG: NAD(P)-dependent oxidoreductase [bacterium]|nr:NAD(P)-dependent oxidoreductase [bacterium]
MSSIFRVGVTHDFLKADGTLGFGDIGLGLLEGTDGVEWTFLKDQGGELRPEQVQGFDALLVLGPQVSAATMEGADRLAVVARFGVGYDNVDVEACTRNGVLLTITPDGVRRPVATSALAFLLALSHKMLIKDRLIRTGRWAEKMDHMGTGLSGRSLGLIGLGNIGREVFALARPLGMRHLAYDPYVTPADAAEAGAEWMDLETLLRTSDFVCICCALTPDTHHLINAKRLEMMKETAYLINVARGPIVDQKALTDALSKQQIQGAALDVFEQEPVDSRDALLGLENVILAPHAICWTDECFLGIGRSACGSILDVAAGREPKNVVNRNVVDHPRVKQNLRRFANRGVR